MGLNQECIGVLQRKQEEHHFEAEASGPFWGARSYEESSLKRGATFEMKRGGELLPQKNPTLKVSKR